jgi:hypothetical protein
MNAPPRLRLSSARLAALFVVIFAAAITLVLSAVYVLTARVLDREVDSVIRSEVAHLVDDYSSGGLLQLVATLRRRTDSWDRTGAVYLLAACQPADSVCRPRHAAALFSGRIRRDSCHLTGIDRQ